MSVQPHETTVEDQAPAPIFQRVLLKLSGEALMGDQEYGIDAPTIAVGGLELYEARCRACFEQPGQPPGAGMGDQPVPDQH